MVLSWLPPGGDGGAPITGYTVTAYAGPSVAATYAFPKDSRSGTATGLTNGVTYSFTVRATNAAGAGPESPPSPPVAPRAVPGPPSISSATPGVGQVTVDWVAPTADGGTPITGYAVFASPGTAVTTVAPSARSATIAGLQNGSSYTFRAVAMNAAGSSPPSAPSAGVTPLAFVALPAPVRMLDTRAGG